MIAVGGTRQSGRMVQSEIVRSPSGAVRFFSYSDLTSQEIFDFFESLGPSQSRIVFIASSEVRADLRL